MKTTIEKIIDSRLTELLRTDIFYFMGSYYRVRTIEQISDNLQAAKDIRQKLFDTHWNPWYKKAEALKGFWGINREGVAECIEASDRGYTTNAVKGDIVREIKTANPEDLPLMMAQPYYKDQIGLIKSLLKGEETSLPLRQDLIDEHDRLDIRFKHINSVIGFYQEFLKRHIERNHYNASRYVEHKYYNEVLYVVTVGKYQYHYLCTRQGAKLISDVELLTIRPEEKMGD